jgi:hypothetical protein
MYIYIHTHIHTRDFSPPYWREVEAVEEQDAEKEVFTP